MPTNEHKAKNFIRMMDEAAEAAAEKLQIDRSDITVNVSVDVETTIRSEYPKQGETRG